MSQDEVAQPTKRPPSWLEEALRLIAINVISAFVVLVIGGIYLGAIVDAASRNDREALRSIIVWTVFIAVAVIALATWQLAKSAFANTRNLRYFVPQIIGIGTFIGVSFFVINVLMAPLSAWLFSAVEWL